MSNAPHPSALLTALCAALFGLALLAPVASAQADVPGIYNPTNVPTPTRLYFHVGANQDFPINTQEPPLSGYERDDGYPPGANSLTCLPETAATAGQTNHRYTTYYGYSSPGYVEYNYTENGSPRTHPERGLSYDVLLDPATQPVVHWYITTFVSSTDAGAPHVDPVIPNVVARATIRTGERISIGDEGYNEGAIIAQGQTDPTTLVAGAKAVGPDGQDNPQVTVDSPGPGQAAIYGFAIPLTFATTTIPKESGYSIRIDLFVQPAPGVCDMKSDDKYAMPSLVKTHTDPKHRPQLDLAILNPIRIEYLHPQFVGDDLVVHTSENSPWGNYDVDESPTGIQLSIVGPHGPVDGVYRAAVVARTHEHDHHTQAVDASFVWPYKDLHAPDGLYTVHLETHNDQGTAKATAIGQFQLGKDVPPPTGCGAAAPNSGAAIGGTCTTEPSSVPTKPNVLSPGLPTLGLVAVLGAGAWAMRRRL